MTPGHTNRGKWSEVGVPHKGWTCVSVEDLEEPAATCEMCESQEIRYVHYMEHPDFAHGLGVGCVCAGKMEQDYVAAEGRERALRNAAKRRAKWLGRRWRESANGNPYLNTDGLNIVVFRRGPRWSGRIVRRDTEEDHFLRRSYSTTAEAKLALFDLMITLIQLRR